MDSMGGHVKRRFSKQFGLVLLISMIATIMATGYVVLPITRALSVAHPPRIAICCQTPADFGMPYDDVMIPAEHGLRLRGWLLPSRNSMTVVVAHGFGSNRLSTLDAGVTLARHGFGVLFIDLLAHGESDGTLLTLTGDDVRAAAHYLQAQDIAKSGAIGVWGFSLGGLEALQAAAWTSEVGAVVADGPFPVVSAEDMPSPESLEDVLWMPFDRVQWKALDWQGVAPHSSVVQALAHIAPRPVLLIAGTRNRGERRVMTFYATAGGKNTRLWQIPEAGHIQSWQVRRNEYEQMIVGFFEQELAQTKAPSGP
jgi:pimeloyl-ACP methyl ester carboxylesterase